MNIIGTSNTGHGIYYNNDNNKIEVYSGKLNITGNSSNGSGIFNEGAVYINTASNSTVTIKANSTNSTAFTSTASGFYVNYNQSMKGTVEVFANSTNALGFYMDNSYYTVRGGNLKITANGNKTSQGILIGYANLEVSGNATFSLEGNADDGIGIHAPAARGNGLNLIANNGTIKFNATSNSTTGIGIGSDWNANLTTGSSITVEGNQNLAMALIYWMVVLELMRLIQVLIQVQVLLGLI